MGILNAGIMGAMYGKLGGMIGSNWKGINTLREYKIPANPQSVAQTAQRTKFAVVVALAQALLGTLIVTFWNPFAVKMSGFNAFIKSVFPNVTSAGLVTADCKVTSGTLENLHSLIGTYEDSTGEVIVTYDAAIQGNGAETDNVSLLIIDASDNSIVGYFPLDESRETGTITKTVHSQLTPSNLIAYVWASRGSGSSFVVSDSVGKVLSAA